MDVPIGNLADFTNVNKEFLPKNSSQIKNSPKKVLPKNSSKKIPPNKSPKQFPKNSPKIPKILKISNSLQRT